MTDHFLEGQLEMFATDEGTVLREGNRGDAQGLPTESEESRTVVPPREVIAHTEGLDEENEESDDDFDDLDGDVEDDEDDEDDFFDEDDNDED